MKALRSLLNALRGTPAQSTQHYTSTDLPSIATGDGVAMWPAEVTIHLVDGRLGSVTVSGTRADGRAVTANYGDWLQIPFALRDCLADRGYGPRRSF